MRHGGKTFYGQVRDEKVTTRTVTGSPKLSSADSERTFGKRRKPVSRAFFQEQGSKLPESTDAVHLVLTSVVSHRYTSPVIHSFQDSRPPQGTRVIVN